MHSLSSQRRALLQLFAAALTLAATPAFAQTKTTRLIVGFPAGGPTDIVALTMSEQFGRELGQTVIVENRPGVSEIRLSSEQSFGTRARSRRHGITIDHTVHTALIALTGSTAVTAAAQ